MYLVRNNLNQVLNITMDDGDSIRVAARGIEDISNEDSRADHVKRLVAKGHISIYRIKPPKETKSDSDAKESSSKKKTSKKS